ncbi:hypothetical protein QU38_01515, partial [Staphylococcus aureus]
LRRAQRGGERVGCDLENGHAARQHEDRGEHDAEIGEATDALHCQASGRHDGQPGQYRPHRAKPGEHRRRRERQQEEGDERSDLGEQCLGIAQSEHAPRCCDQRIIVRADKAPAEEQRRHARKGEARRGGGCAQRGFRQRKVAAPC